MEYVLLALTLSVLVLSALIPGAIAGIEWARDIPARKSARRAWKEYERYGRLFSE